MEMEILRNRIFSLSNSLEFEMLALETFHYQAVNNLVYAEYLQHLNVQPTYIKTIEAIPFLPIEFFKNKEVISGDQKSALTFTSSGTTGAITSQHFVVDPQIYEQSFSTAFELFYGNAEKFAILALLPAYLERAGSSLVYMADYLIKRSHHSASGFYLYNHDELYQNLIEIIDKNQKAVLLGVSFGLLDFAEKFSLPANQIIVMETGGMKGRRKELTRDEMHGFLTQQLGVQTIHSEYGMTELLSQAYSKGEGKYQTPPWMKILIRDTYDPFSYLPQGQTGGVNIIDLANLYSCSFIETKDLGKLAKDGSFEILGRFDQSDIRGCNLMVG